MTEPEPLLVEDRGLVTWITLNRPARLNAVNAALYQRLREELPRLHDSSSVRAIVLTGAGRAFSAGGDVKAMTDRTTRFELELEERELDRTAERDRLEHVHATILQLSRVPKPVIAGINGAAAGAGLSLALLGDYRLASRSAVVTTAFASVGLPGDSGISLLLAETVGRHRARLLLMRPRRIRADEALDIGLVDEVVDAEDFPARLEEVAAEMAAGSPAVYRAVKRDLLPCEGLASTLDRELRSTLSCQESQDHAAAIARFRAS